MPYAAQHLTHPPSRDDVARLPGATVVAFGTPWCGPCHRAQPLIENALAAWPLVAHLKVEDGPGQRLGRSFGVKLWPTLIALRDGREVARCVRPQQAQEIHDAVALAITQAGVGDGAA